MSKVESQVEKAKDVGQKLAAQAKDEMEALKRVDWRSKGASAKASAKECADAFRQANWMGRVELLKSAAVSTGGFFRSVWNFGLVGKAACVVGGLFVLSFGSCVFSSGDGFVAPHGVRCEGRLLDLRRDMLVFSADPQIELEEGIGLVHRAGYTVCQCVDGGDAVLARYTDEGLNGDAADMSMLAEFLEKNCKGPMSAQMLKMISSNGMLVLAAIMEMKQKIEQTAAMNPVLIRTDRKYVDGTQLAAGIYVYDGPKTLPAADGSTMTVKSFHEIDPDFYEKVNDAYLAELEKARKRDDEQKRKQAEKDHAAYKRAAKEKRDKERVGNVLDIGDSKVKSFCGFQFGHPEIDQEPFLGEDAGGAAASVGRFGSDCWKLRKPFRWCDTVIPTYKGTPPNRVLVSLILFGKMTAEQKSVCEAEMDAVCNMIKEKFGLVYRQSYDRGMQRKLAGSKNVCAEDLVTVDSQGDYFTITVESCGAERAAACPNPREIAEEEAKRKERSDKQRNDKSGADQL